MAKLLVEAAIDEEFAGAEGEDRAAFISLAVAGITVEKVQPMKFWAGVFVGDGFREPKAVAPGGGVGGEGAVYEGVGAARRNRACRRRIRSWEFPLAVVACCRWPGWR